VQLEETKYSYTVGSLRGGGLKKSGVGRTFSGSTELEPFARELASCGVILGEEKTTPHKVKKLKCSDFMKAKMG